MSTPSLPTGPLTGIPLVPVVPPTAPAVAAATTPAAAPTRQAASFRDPSGFIFHGPDGVLLRQVNRIYEADYRRLQESGLYVELTEQGLLIEHKEVDRELRVTDDALCVIQPERVPLISYPYEWSFSQLQDAALLTLDIQQRALAHGMTLKDASCYNVQFLRGRPVMIDTLSLETYEKGRPWVAYGQFCRHFLGPLALMAHTDMRLQRLLTTFIDGVPLDLAASLLPWQTRLRPGLLVHMHLHARSQRKHQDTSDGATARPPRQLEIKPYALAGLLDSLRRTTAGLRWRAAGTEWADYYENNSYSNESHRQKRDAVAEMIGRVAPRTAWDLGANTGLFSRLAAEAGADVVAFDIDPACVEQNYLAVKRDGEPRMLPLALDLTNPSPAIGWANRERDALADRGPVDLVMALALVHHLAIANNVPLGEIAAYFARLGRHLIIEFVPKEDVQVQRLLRGREDIFAEYTPEGFEAAFAPHFETLARHDLERDGRVLYLLRARGQVG